MIGIPDLAEIRLASVLIVLRPDFSGGFAKRFCAYGFGLVDALPLVFSQPGYDEPGIYCLSLENFRSTLRDILCQGRLDDGRALKTQRSP